ncbi:seryl-tRNA synthetase [Pseudogymnoascus sp. 03VT05]|nr:seryl-tRNA synthetase [Pseudogymnoascus sp. 03VT05]
MPPRIRPLLRRPQWRCYHPSPRLRAEPSRPSIAQKPTIDIKHIRQNPDLYTQNAIERNYGAQSSNPQRINELFAQWQGHQRDGRSMREQSNVLQAALANPKSAKHQDAARAIRFEDLSRDGIIAASRSLKSKLASIETEDAELTRSIEGLALELPNFTSPDTPRGHEPKVLSYINEHPSGDSEKSHVDIGTSLGILDFASAGSTSGWGWYYLMGAAAQLEQALVQFALSKATARGWTLVAPPSIVYSHVAAACGFMPRDHSGETQIYTIAQGEGDVARGRPELCLAGTAEIPLAGMGAGAVLDAAVLPRKYVAASRCYRAEAGARGVDTKGLYRVHEFTKVELFSWTTPELEAATEVFEEIVDMQVEVLRELGLHCRVLEMPSTDLGASAFRKKDIEAFFPSRRGRDEGYGEVTSASVCTDFQARRLGTKMSRGGKKEWVYTVNGTGMAVPRVLAAVLENGWDEGSGEVRVPKCLWPWMGGMEVIKGKNVV